MSRFDRYLLSQLLMLFGFFALVLVSVYWVNKAVQLFDTLVSDGHSAWVFLELTALTLPNVIRLVLPFAAFVATLYVTNRLSGESELVVMQATGFSPFRLARPVLFFGLVVALMMSALVHVLVPASRQRLAERTDDIAANVTAQFLSDGVFLHPAEGVTFYIREITPGGELRDIFLSDARSDRSGPGSGSGSGSDTNSASRTEIVYTAERALLAKGANGPMLVMFDGLAQTLRKDTGLLATTRFADFAYDIGALLKSEGPRRIAPEQLPTPRLFAADAETLAATRRSPEALRLDGHGRFVDALLPVFAVLLGFGALLTGGYSRFGMWRQMAIAAVLIVLLQLAQRGAEAATIRDPGLWPLIYLPTLAGLILAAGLLGFAGRERKTPPSAAATGAAAT